LEWRASLDEDPATVRTPARLDCRGAGGAVFTRYDGWVIALLAWLGIGVTLMRRGGLRSRSFWLGSAVLAAAPSAWFLYNAPGIWRLA